MIRLFDLPSKMVCAFTNEVRNIPVTIITERRGFYKEERIFIYAI